MRRFQLVVLWLTGLVGLSSCEILDIVAPTTAHAGDNIAVRVAVGVAENDQSFSFCMQAPVGWTHNTPSYTITGETPASGSLTTLNASGAASFETEEGSPGYVWTCYTGPAHAEDDRGEVQVGFTVGTPGTYVLRFGLRTTLSAQTASHTIVVDGVPQFDANARHEMLVTNATRIAHGNDVFVMAASANQTIVDANGTRTVHDAGVTFRDITFGAGKFIGVGDDKAIKSSTDGKTWSALLTPTVADADLNVVYRGATRFIAAGDAGTILESADGITWTPAATTGLDATLQWDHGAASATADVLVDTDGLVVAVSDDGAPFQARALADYVGSVAYTPTTGWIFAGVDGFVQSSNLVDAVAITVREDFFASAVFAAVDTVYLSTSGRLYRVSGAGVVEVGTNSSVLVRDGVDDGRRLLMAGVVETGRVYTVELPHLALSATELVFTSVGEQHTVTVRNDGLGALYLTGVTASGAATVAGCENAVLAPDSACTVTVTLTDGTNPGTVTIGGNGPRAASQVVTLSYAPAPLGGDGDGDGAIDGGGNAKEDSGCAAAPGASLGVLLSFLALRRRLAVM